MRRLTIYPEKIASGEEDNGESYGNHDGAEIDPPLVLATGQKCDPAPRLGKVICCDNAARSNSRLYVTDVFQDSRRQERSI
jgi:hypothetical protein